MTFVLLFHSVQTNGLAACVDCLIVDCSVIIRPSLLTALFSHDIFVFLANIMCQPLVPRSQVTRVTLLQKSFHNVPDETWSETINPALHLLVADSLRFV